VENIMQGWESIVIPGRALYRGFASRTAWGRGSFGIFDYDFVHDDAGEASVTFLFHQKTGYRLAVFMSPKLAVEGVTLIEDAVDWDEVLKNAKDQGKAQDIFYNAIGKRWSHFIPFEWAFDGMNALTRKATAEEATQDKIAARQLVSLDV
jgi:hypothetical protein